MWLPYLMLLAAARAVAAQPQSGAASCQAVVTLSTNWVQTSNNATFASVNLDIISTQAAIVPVPWTLTLKNSAYGMIKQVIFSFPPFRLNMTSVPQCASSVTEPLRGSFPCGCLSSMHAHRCKLCTCRDLCTPGACACLSVCSSESRW